MTPPRLSRSTLAETVGLSYKLQRDVRARRVILRVCPERGVVVTLPVGAPVALAQQALAAKERWLRARLQELEARRRQLAGADGTLPFLGQRLSLVAVPGVVEASLRPAEGVVQVPAGECREAVFRLLAQAAKDRFWRRLAELGGNHGLHPRALAVRNQRTRWGSCSPTRGLISLNWRLVLAPPWISDYVLWHELLHLRVANHSPRFWRLLGELYPQAQSARRWLARNGWQLDLARPLYGRPAQAAQGLLFKELAVS